MVRVAPIKLQVGTKVFWFDPEDKDVHKDDHVVVKTERGIEYGQATADIMDVSEEVVKTLKSPLKPVLRVATPADETKAAELEQRSREALSVFKEFAAQTSDQMHPVTVEFLFDGDKAVFYFEAEERVDFRDLVRRLASHFHVRIDMRQIGVRDAARIVGGLGHCGQELCCKRLGGEFSPVSIRMAKEQNLSLNPQKISGCCGRLMCFLRYEFETYKEVNSRAPKHGAKVEVPGGMARVTEINVPLEKVSLLLEDGKTIQVPLADMDIVGDGKRPNRVSQEVFDRCSEPDPMQSLTSSSLFEVADFTGEEKLADLSHKHRSKQFRHLGHAESAQEESHRKPRRRRRGGSQGRANEKDSQGERLVLTKGDRDQTEKPKREGSSLRSRRSRSKQAGQQGGAQRPGAERRREDSQERRSRSQRRPGQCSSGVRNAPVKDVPATKQESKGNQGDASTRSHRRPRRRRSSHGGETADVQ